MTTLLSYIRLPLITLFRALIDYLESTHPTTNSPLDLSDLENQLTNSPPAQSERCFHCIRSSIVCPCHQKHCSFHRPRLCRSQAA